LEYTKKNWSKPLVFSEIVSLAGIHNKNADQTEQKIVAKNQILCTTQFMKTSLNDVVILSRRGFDFIVKRQ